MGDAPSAWLADLPALAPAPALEGAQRVDVAIVGAGYTGLSCALALRAEGYSVAVLERETAGFGASGRNAGILAPVIGKDVASLPRTVGPEPAKVLYALVVSAVREVEQLIERHGIACDYHPGGNVMAAVHPSQHARLERAARIAETLGAEVELLDRDAMGKRGLPACFIAGVLKRPGGTLHPARYLRGLRAAALAAGAALYERTPVLRLDEGSRVVLTTPRGTVSAERAVLATNAYTPELGRLRSLAVPLWSSLFRTAPLDADERRALDWRGREGVYTAHDLFECYQLTADGRLLGGGRTVGYGFAGRPAPATPAAAGARYERLLRERFPMLRAPIESCWSGPFACALDFLPALGVRGRHRNVFHAIAYAGHGLSLASAAGRWVADAIAGRDGPAQPLFKRRHMPFPPEPLRWLALHASTALFAARDARLDRKLRAGR
ncbi:MAG TPA: FAD-dependent oxidoreductase [Candidatus Acidoferrales bacterium]|nr:FAD-dependent oxidoreductase [Candidatus Acidoferrales bacterium]